jgi:hypothetical protein
LKTTGVDYSIKERDGQRFALESKPSKVGLHIVLDKIERIIVVENNFLFHH